MPADGSPPDGAVAIATVAATLAAHIEQCKTDKAEIRFTQAEIKASLAKQDADRLSMHHENQSRFKRLETVYYFATAVLAIAMFLSTTMGQRVLSVMIHQ